MKIWSYLHEKLSKDIPCLLMVVVQSHGSSPGRQGFKMAIADDGTILGSIGGGIMEHKLVEQARSILSKGKTQLLIKKQIHRKDSPINRSGMICSGQQTVALVPISSKLKEPIQNILSLEAQQLLHIHPYGISFSQGQVESPPFKFHFNSEEDWHYQESISHQETIHIIGGGHVGLAFSTQMAYLGFRVNIYDNRPNLNTMAQNSFAHQKIIIDYEKIATAIPSNKDHYVVIMTFGYRTDKSVLKQLLYKNFKYIGMMGSEAKTKQLFQELKKEGVPIEKIQRVHSPIGVSISSKTPEEIAVSIAAQIIQIKNNFTT